MCQFISAVIMQNGEILCNPRDTDSHEDLLQAANIRDGVAQQGKFVRIEFLPPEDRTRIFDTSAWTLKVDQKDVPSWFDKTRVRSSMVAIVEGMLVREDRDLLSKGCWILMDGVTVKTVKNVRVYAMLGTSKILEARGTSKVDMMCDSSIVGAMYDSSVVDMMYNSSWVDRMYDSSRIKWMFDSSKIERMNDSSKVDMMYDSSGVGCMLDSSEIGKMHNSSRVGWLAGLSRVGGIYDSSKMGVLLGSPNIQR